MKEVFWEKHPQDIVSKVIRAMVPYQGRGKVQAAYEAECRGMGSIAAVVNLGLTAGLFHPIK
jgi:hypothetical protein